MITWERDADGVVTLTMDDPEARVNTMNERFQEAMDSVLERLDAERDDVTGVILTSAKSSFFAGGDLNMLAAAGPQDAQSVFDMTQRIKAQLRTLETQGLPVVAALNGTALGGGLEIALACHHRIAVMDPALKVGLPEVTLGLLPGGGGITRLTRMLGLETALTDWLLQGTQYRAEAAHEKGVIDQLVADQAQLLPAAKAWLAQHRGDDVAATKAWDRKGFSFPGGTPSHRALAARLPAFPATLRKTLHGADLPAPKAILCAAVEGAQVNFDTAARIETRYFVGLVTGGVSTAMIQAFHTDMNSLRSGRTLGGRVSEPRTVRSVAVIGAGMMGAGIAHAFASNGVDVVLKDVDLAHAERGRRHARTVLEKRVSRGSMTQQKADRILERIRPTASYGDLADVDVVIEAVFEDHELKTAVFAEVEKVVRPDTLLATNTSTLPITSLQAPSSRPADMVGLHFFSPVDRMNLVEIIRGERTSRETVERAYDLVQLLRKVPILVNDSRGFYTSRVFGTLVLEGAAMVEEGVDPHRVERAARRAGFPAGPLALLDEVSLTLVQHIRREETKAAEEAGRGREAQPGESAVDRMVNEFHRAGRAAGAGFYDYPDDGPKQLWPGLWEHFATDAHVPEQDLQDRFLYRMAVETARCFEEGVLTDTASANLGGILGIGYPPHTGGPAMFMTNRPDGLSGFVNRADELAQAYGERFRPGQWLRERAESVQGVA